MDIYKISCLHLRSVLKYFLLIVHVQVIFEAMKLYLVEFNHILYNSNGLYLWPHFFKHHLLSFGMTDKKQIMVGWCRLGSGRFMLIQLLAADNGHDVNGKEDMAEMWIAGLNLVLVSGWKGRHHQHCVVINYLFKTFTYSLLYIPFPGPPAEKDPPPPIIMLSTQ